MKRSQWLLLLLANRNTIVKLFREALALRKMQAKAAKAETLAITAQREIR
jgi:hypothetical protein